MGSWLQLLKNGQYEQFNCITEMIILSRNNEPVCNVIEICILIGFLSYLIALRFYFTLHH